MSKSHKIEQYSAIKRLNVGQTLAQMLIEVGVTHAWGVSGGAIASIVNALTEADLKVRHARHEGSALFQATEGSLATGLPTAAFATTGPGLMNTLTGILSARTDGAKIVLLSATSPAKTSGRWGVQETSSYSMPISAIYQAGPLFDDAICLRDAHELQGIRGRLQRGLNRPQGYVAHIAIPMDLAVQFAPKMPPLQLRLEESRFVDERTIRRVLQRLQNEKAVLWCGHGAMAFSEQIVELAERLNAPVMTTPRGKGVISEHHELSLGVTGLGGHEEVNVYLKKEPVDVALVLGTRLGEASTFWDESIIPEGGLIHVDVDAGIPGSAFPNVATDAVIANIGDFMEQLLERLPKKTGVAALSLPSRPLPPPPQTGQSPVRHSVLMEVIQRKVIDESEALLMSESGNSFGFANHYLRFSDAKRYRTCPASMGQMTAGVVGAAEMLGKKTVAIVGDGAMLMNNEINTAAQLGTPAVWIVLNDARYGIVRVGNQLQKLTTEGCEFPRVDFVALAESLGASGVRVEREDQLEGAMDKAMKHQGPFVVDVQVDPDAVSPAIEGRVRIIMGNKKGVKS